MVFRHSIRYFTESVQDPHHTRQTLILRLRDHGDSASWEEFVEIYTPLLYAYCQKREIQKADTADIVQVVLRSIAQSISGFDYDPQKGRFKAWLFTVLRNAISKHFRKAKRAPLTVSDTAILHAHSQDPDQREIADWESDYRLQLFAWAYEKVRPEFNERILAIFEATAIRDEPLEDVAAHWDTTKNAVAVAKHRVIKRVRKKIATIDPERWEQEMSRQANKP